MSDERREKGVGPGRGWIRGVLVVLVVAGALGVFTSQARLQRPALGPLNVAGIAVMLAGLAAVVLARAIAVRVLKRDAGAAALVKLAGVLVCGVGAAMVFL